MNVTPRSVRNEMISRLKSRKTGRLMLRILCILATMSATSTAFALDVDKKQSPPDISRLALPEPVSESRSRLGNDPTYVVWGQTYRVQPTALGYKEEGTASWYGEKFHGRLTANGDLYDMYQFSAAHRTLPLPTWLKVTNLENGKWLYVRVNDRGPFHDNRIIDLSYAAAFRLGMLEKGTARVALEYVAVPVRVPAQQQTQPVTGEDNFELGPFMLQVGSFNDRARAERLTAILHFLVEPATFIKPSVLADERTIFRVQVGPVHDIEEAKEMQALIAISLEELTGQPIIQLFDINPD